MTRLRVLSTFTANFECLPNKIKLKVKKKEQPDHTTRPITHQLEKIIESIKEKIKERERQKKLFSNASNNRQDSLLFRGTTMRMNRQPDNTEPSTRLPKIQ